MARWSRITVVCGAVGVCLLTAGSSFAAVTLNLNYEFSGAASPAGAPPWLVAVFEDTANTDEVMLTMTAPGLINSEFVRKWAFNLDTTMDPDDLIITHQSGEVASSVGQASPGDQYKADGDGWYDILFDFPGSGDRFMGGDTSIYLFSGISGLSENSFNFLSTPGGGNGTYASAAHIQAIDTPPGSGWIGVTGGGGQEPGVPEPATLVIWSLLGALSLGVCRLRNRRKGA